MPDEQPAEAPDTPSPAFQQSPAPAALTPEAVHERLLDIVDKPAWKQLLVETVEQSGLDPWNIDVTSLASAYLEKINAMRKLDFRIPANCVLCSAILLRFKAQNWQIQPQQEFEEAVEEDNWQLIIEGQQVPDLEPSRRITNRPVTIEELIMAVEDVIEKQRKREEKRLLESMVPEALMDIAFEDNEDFLGMVDEVYRRVLKNADSTEIALFSDVLRERSKREIMLTLIPLLHLANQDRVRLWQEKYFDEIFILLKPNGHSEEAAEAVPKPADLSSYMGNGESDEP
jgi:chromatin segregation and condensation protein Rec8/ScpA/Scc1 (kleisin family)